MRILLVLLLFSYSTMLFSAACGSEGQRPCTVFERIPSCDPGLLENISLGKCVTPIPATSPQNPVSSNPTIRKLAKECGAKNRRPCRIFERVPSCNSGLVEDFSKNLCVSRGGGSSQPATPTKTNTPPPPLPKNCGGYNQVGCQSPNGRKDKCNAGYMYYYQQSRCLNADPTREYASWIKFANGDLLGLYGQSTSTGQWMLPVYLVSGRYQVGAGQPNVQPGQCLSPPMILGAVYTPGYKYTGPANLRVNFFNSQLESGNGNLWAPYSPIVRTSSNFQGMDCSQQPDQPGTSTPQRTPESRFGCDLDNRWKWIQSDGNILVEPVECTSLLRSRWVVRHLRDQGDYMDGVTDTPVDPRFIKLNLSQSKFEDSLTIDNVRCALRSDCSSTLVVTDRNGIQYSFQGHWYKI